MVVTLRVELEETAHWYGPIDEPRPFDQKPKRPFDQLRERW
jgi:hypothetical protein